MKSFDKYQYYQLSVQNPSADISFMKKVYRGIYKSSPQVFGEDFCGTFANSVEWVRSGGVAIGVDIDAEPIAWGVKNNASKLTAQQKTRLRIRQASVLSGNLPKADLICALNFSYMTLQTRQELRDYLKTIYKRLHSKGLVVFDAMGGTDCQIPSEEIRKFKDFTYIWELEDHDPIHNTSLYHIHYKTPKKTHKRVFTYDWRMWSLPEIRELMAEAGFKRSYVYWESHDRHGNGNGLYKRREKGEPCETWIAYIVGCKT